MPEVGDQSSPAKPRDFDNTSQDVPRLFAVVSMILSKHEIENSVCDEPFLCVHELCSSEAEAMNSALHVTSQSFKNAVLCVLPGNDVIHFEDAYKFCAQVEPDRREKRGSSATVLSPNRHKSSTSGKATASSPARAANARNDPAGAAALSPSTSTSTPTWQTEREKARRLHQFICSRLGQKAIADKERKEQQQQESGFTPKPLLTLEEKLSTLHEYLESANASVSKGGNALGKYRQMKKFGSIMKARLNSTLATSGLSAALIAMTASNGAAESGPLAKGTGAAANP
jgi:hypothetical protein